MVIDGPAGAGKTTAARALARRLGLPLLDTGAIYRTLALVAKRVGVSWDDEVGLTRLCQHFDISFGELESTGRQKVFYEGEDVSAAIRTEDISEGASVVSAHRGVRAALLPIQRALGARGCVAEGRDMGTVVFPDAPYKFFVTANLQTRARRRHEELLDGSERSNGASGGEGLETVQRDLQARDTRDASRPTAPLAQAPDAVVIDTSDLDVDAVVDAMMNVIEG